METERKSLAMEIAEDLKKSRNIFRSLLTLSLIVNVILSIILIIK